MVKKKIKGVLEGELPIKKKFAIETKVNLPSCQTFYGQKYIFFFSFGTHKWHGLH